MALVAFDDGFRVRSLDVHDFHNRQVIENLSDPLLNLIQAQSYGKRS